MSARMYIITDTGSKQSYIFKICIKETFNRTFYIQSGLSRPATGVSRSWSSHELLRFNMCCTIT